MNDKSIGCLNGNMLKIIACFAMLLDHIGYTFIQNHNSSLYLWLSCVIGRLAFPIFIFLLAEGLYYTRDRKKYVGRMCLFALVSEIPYNLMMSGKLFDLTRQNVYFTLALGLIMCVFIEKIEENTKDKELIMLLFECACVAIFAAIAQLLHFDYGAFGIIAIYLCYVFREFPLVAGITESIVLASMGSGELAVIFSPLILMFYNGKRGKLNLKYPFYIFYPAHILVLGIIRVLLIEG